MPFFKTKLKIQFIVVLSIEKYTYPNLKTQCVKKVKSVSDTSAGKEKHLQRCQVAANKCWLIAGVWHEELRIRIGRRTEQVSVSRWNNQVLTCLVFVAGIVEWDPAFATFNWKICFELTLHHKQDIQVKSQFVKKYIFGNC